MALRSLITGDSSSSTDLIFDNCKCWARLVIFLGLLERLEKSSVELIAGKFAGEFSSWLPPLMPTKFSLRAPFSDLYFWPSKFFRSCSCLFKITEPAKSLLLSLAIFVFFCWAFVACMTTLGLGSNSSSWLMILASWARELQSLWTFCFR